MKGSKKSKEVQIAHAPSKTVARKESPAIPDASKDKKDEVEVEDIFPNTPVAQASLLPPKSPHSRTRSITRANPVIVHLPATPEEDSNCSSTDPRFHALCEIATQVDQLLEENGESGGKGNDDDNDNDEEEDDTNDYAPAEYDNLFENELSSHLELKILGPGTLAHAVRSMYLMYEQGQKKRRGVSFLFENLRTLVLVLAYEELTKTEREKQENLNFVMYTLVIGLLQNMPHQSKHQRDLFRYMVPDYESDFDVNKRYDWPQGFTDYVISSCIPKNTDDKVNKAKDKASKAGASPGSGIAKEKLIGGKFISLAQTWKSEVTKDMNGEWGSLSSGDSVPAKNLRLLRSIWEEDEAWKASENARRCESNINTTMKEKDLSFDAARKLNQEEAVKTCKMKFKTKKMPSWYPHCWLYFLRHGAPAKIEMQKACTTTKMADLTRLEAEPTSIRTEAAKSITTPL